MVRRASTVLYHKMNNNHPQTQDASPEVSRHPRLSSWLLRSRISRGLPPGFQPLFSTLDCTGPGMQALAHSTWAPPLVLSLGCRLMGGRVSSMGPGQLAVRTLSPAARLPA